MKISQFKLAHISLAFICLMWVFPFLYWVHDYPITTFYQELIAGILGLCAVPLLIASRIEVPRIVLLPIGMILVVMAQFLIGRVDYVDQIALFSMYMIFAALLMMLGYRLKAALGLPAVVTALAVALLIGAELNSLAGILQHYKWDTFLSAFVVGKVAQAIYGNMAQPNHFADYLALGVTSLWLLYERFSMRISHVVILAAPILFCMILSGSRSALLYLAVISAVIFHRVNARKFVYVGLSLVAFAVAVHFVIHSGATIFDRIIIYSGESVRLHLWRNAFLI